jgi:hypothetical protein
MEDWKLGFLFLLEVGPFQSQNLEPINLFVICPFNAFLYFDTMHLQIYHKTISRWYIMYTEYRLQRNLGVSNLNSPWDLPSFLTFKERTFEFSLLMDPNFCVCYLCISKGWLQQFNSDNLVRELGSHLISLV